MITCRTRHRGELIAKMVALPRRPVSMIDYQRPRPRESPRVRVVTFSGIQLNPVDVVDVGDLPRPAQLGMKHPPMWQPDDFAARESFERELVAVGVDARTLDRRPSALISRNAAANGLIDRAIALPDVLRRTSPVADTGTSEVRRRSALGAKLAAGSPLILRSSDSTSRVGRSTGSRPGGPPAITPPAAAVSSTRVQFTCWRSGLVAKCACTRRSGRWAFGYISTVQPQHRNVVASTSASDQARNS